MKTANKNAVTLHCRNPPPQIELSGAKDILIKVRRLLQLGTLMLLLAAFFTPLIEFFDRRDLAGPSNDTEMAVFGLIFALCLVLIVCKLTAALATLISLVLVLGLQHS